MKRKIELLAPGGDIDSIKAAIAAGADAVYCGVNKFNARNRATNITFEDLNGILRLAHKNSCEVFLTLNIIITEQEFPDLLRLLNKLVNTSIDGVIVQDLGLLYILSKYFKGLRIHASTQLTTHNEGQIKFLSQLNATRVNLSRELSLQEIKPLTTVARQNGLLTELFVHGSYCISFSGLCYMSSVHGGNSGNRGRCSQPCREQYELTPEGNHFPLNLKDNSAWFDLKEISDAGVDSIKIEGRIKKYHYVYTVVESFRKQLQHLHDEESPGMDNGSLYKVFNRGFSNGYLKGDINRDMFIDNPRDNSATHLAELTGDTSDEAIQNAENDLYAEKGGIRSFVKSITDQLSVGKAPLRMIVSGKAGTPLKMTVKTPDSSAILTSKIALVNHGEIPLNEKEILKRFKAINDTEYYIGHLDPENLDPGLHIPFSELTSLRNQILFFLRDSREHIAPVKLPELRKPVGRITPPTLSVLISSRQDVHLCNDTTAGIYFQLPDAISAQLSELIPLFRENERLIPWFPSILTGKEYDAAVAFLKVTQPGQIVTNNTGIALEADQMGISWIAGPFLNIANSYSLLCLKESFNCTGAFISNELSRMQIGGIKKPDDFNLYYSIYHPIELMTSRQCLFHQVTGCEKERIDEECMQSCQQSASITNLKKETFYIEKTAGNHHRIYHENRFLNTDIVTDMPDLFAGFLIDLRDIKTDTRIEVDRLKTVALFEQHLQGISGSAQQLKHVIHPSTHTQYIAGI